MSTPDLAPRGTFGGVIAVWVVAAVMGIAIGVFVPLTWQAAWMVVGMAGCLVLSFVVQLWYGRPLRFTQRVAAGALGALLILGLTSTVFALAALLS